MQTWNTRCEIVKSRGKLEGSPQCNQGGVVGFACSGDQALCFNALKAQEAKCKAEYDDAINADQAAQIAGQGDGLDGVNVSDIYGQGEDETGQINEGLLGGSTGQCEFAAPLEIAGQSIEIPSGLWQLLGMIQMLLTASAYLWVASQLSR